MDTGSFLTAVDGLGCCSNDGLAPCVAPTCPLCDVDHFHEEEQRIREAACKEAEESLVPVYPLPPQHRQLVTHLPVMRRIHVREAVLADKRLQKLAGIQHEARMEAHRRFVELIDRTPGGGQAQREEGGGALRDDTSKGSVKARTLVARSSSAQPHRHSTPGKRLTGERGRSAPPAPAPLPALVEASQRSGAAAHLTRLVNQTQKMQRLLESFDRDASQRHAGAPTLRSTPQHQRTSLATSLGRPPLVTPVRRRVSLGTT